MKQIQAPTVEFVLNEKTDNYDFMLNGFHYTLAMPADPYAQPYGVLKKGDAYFMPLNKGKGKKVWAAIKESFHTHLTRNTP